MKKGNMPKDIRPKGDKADMPMKPPPGHGAMHGAMHGNGQGGTKKGGK
jgi:hypothetical protein